MKIRILLTAFFLLAFSYSCLFAASLSFEEAQNEAVSANREALSSKAFLENAREKEKSARAALYPYVYASGAYSRNGAQGLNSYDSYSYGVSASMPLLDTSLMSAAKSASLEAESAQASFDKIISEIKYSLRLSFAGIAQAESEVEISLKNIERRKENLQLLQLKYKAGLESKSALLETETALKLALWQHENYLKNLKTARRNLNLLLGRPVSGADLEIKLPPAEIPPESLDLKSLIEKHYDFRIAYLKKELAREALKSASNEAMPRLSADAYYGYAGRNISSADSSRRAGITITLPLFSSGKIASQKKAAQFSFESAGLEMENLKDDLYIKAEDAYMQWRQAYAYLEVAQSSLEASRLRAWLVRKQYLSGQSAYFEWRSVEDALIESEHARVKADSSAYSAYAAFLKSIGE